MPHGFVENGHDNAVVGCRDEVRKEVLARYESEWKRAGPLGRVVLCLRMHGEIRREVRRRIGRKAPADALYLRRT
jgi:hypothetical protein